LRTQAGLPALQERPKPSIGREVFAEVLHAIAYGQGPWKHRELLENYRTLQDQHNYVLGHYFRNLFQIIKLVDESAALSDIEKQKYASILRAQLSSDELALLMINCTDQLVDHGQFRTLLVRYRLLEHLPLIRVESEFQYAGQNRIVVLANADSIKQFLLVVNATITRKIYRGAFGTNPGLGGFR